MPHPIYGPAEHALESLEVRLTLPTRRNGRLAQLTVHGNSTTKRGSLWTVQEQWTHAEQQHGLQPADMLHHLVLASFQDRPVTSGGLQRSLGTPGWEDTPLPF